MFCNLDVLSALIQREMQILIWTSRHVNLTINKMLSKYEQ